MQNKSKKIFIAGHHGMVGAAVMKALILKGYTNCFGATSKELDLRNQNQVQEFFFKNKPDFVIDAAAKVGGILANSSFPYQFLMDNLQIQNNLIDVSLKVGVEKFIFLGSSCIYPKFAPQPIKEEYLLESSLEPTNQWYAIAKIAGVKACEAIKVEFDKDFVSLMPTNLYGDNDNFDLTSSHVIPGMLRKFHDAKTNNINEVVLWGSGTPLREFLHISDMANAVVFAVENKLPGYLYNVGSGKEITIKDLAILIKSVTGFEGEIIWDSSKPDGTPRKLMDSSKYNALGWNAKIDLEEGMIKTYNWFLQNFENYRGK